MHSNTVDDEDLEGYAYHEAGHAVVAWALSVRVLDVQIGVHNISRDGLGWRQIDPEMMPQRDWHYAERKARILLGGEMAERRAVDDHDWDYEYGWLFTSETDRQQLDDLIQQLPFDTDESRRKWLARMEDEAKTIVIENWTKVRALATILLQRRSLAGPEATQIIQDG